jgi:large subunit ribosomal protein L10
MSRSGGALFSAPVKHWRLVVDRAEKKEMVGELNQIFSEAGVIVVTQCTGLTVAEMSELRAQMRGVNANFKVIKNRLAKIALDGTEAGSLSEYFSGPTAIAYSSDPVAAPKAVSNFAKKNEKLVIMGGAFGAQALDADGVKALASLLSLDELRGKVVGLLNAPATKVVRVLGTPGGQVARVVNAYATKDAA